MRHLRTALGHGERGFTLIEILVVVFLLGLLAAIVGLSVVEFIGRGTVDAANTEVHNVQIAVTAYMVDNNLETYDGGNIGPNTATGTPPEPEDFLLNAGGLQAIYTMDDDGAIVSAEKIDDSKWGDLEYDAGEGWHEPEPE